MSRAPSWSVKGIDEETRAFARSAARAAGMTIGLIWDVGMIAAFSYQATQGAYLPSSPIPATTYPIAVYGTLAALMGIHLYTLVAIIRDDREGVL